MPPAIRKRRFRVRYARKKRNFRRNRKNFRTKCTSRRPEQPIPQRNNSSWKSLKSSKK
ncbi:unnamed protein product [Cylicostephanus goldi]|uniref:Uncharacterized protein n=1 Tax=Cylicostephanus goldi TaxID=71465 RepID=A0A3P6S1H4_CYLGO|nr:unnamed protein product [Cylicostephanus goldi]